MDARRRREDVEAAAAQPTTRKRRKGEDAPPQEAPPGPSSRPPRLSHPILVPGEPRPLRHQPAREFYALLGSCTPPQLPIVYSQDYAPSGVPANFLVPNSSLAGHVAAQLLAENLVAPDASAFTTPQLPTHQHLAEVHDQAFLDALCDPQTYVTWMGLGKAKVERLCSAGLFARWLESQLLQVSGSILSAHLAVERGWAVNLGGGRHHCSHNSPGWFCFFSDITLLIRHARKAYPSQVKKVVIVDLDTHQGNGHEVDKLFFQDNDTIIVDAFNKSKYPNSRGTEHSFEKQAIDYPIPLTKSQCSDNAYMQRLASVLEAVATDHPDASLVVYNNGGDVLKRDAFKADLNLTPSGVCRRDLLVCRFARNTLRVPFCMLLSGGYGPTTTKAMGDAVCAVVRECLGGGGGGGGGLQETAGKG